MDQAVAELVVGGIVAEDVEGVADGDVVVAAVVAGVRIVAVRVDAERLAPSSHGTGNS